MGSHLRAHRARRADRLDAPSPGRASQSILRARAAVCCFANRRSTREPQLRPETILAERAWAQKGRTHGMSQPKAPKRRERAHSEAPRSCSTASASSTGRINKLGERDDSAKRKIAKTRRSRDSWFFPGLCVTCKQALFVRSGRKDQEKWLERPISPTSN